MRAAGVAIDHVLEIAVDDAEIISRVSGRRVHPASGRTYHEIHAPPKVPGRDDVTGEALIQRDDDREQTVRNRLDVYQRQTRPLVDYYLAWSKTGVAGAPRYACIAGVGAVDEISRRLLAAMGTGEGNAG
jgi:adenylate kinase